MFQAHPWSSKYVPFVQRPTCESLEEKMEKLRKKKEREAGKEKEAEPDA